MGAEYERGLLARAHGLADTDDLAEEVTGILGGARAARVDPDALPGLTAAALILGADSVAVYRAEDPRYADDSEFAAGVADADDEISNQLAAVRRLAGQIEDAAQAAAEDLRAARAALTAARAMATSVPCNGCHRARDAAITAAQAAIADAEERAAICETAATVARRAAAQLAVALTRIRRVPDDYGDTYEPVIGHRQAGRLLPKDGDWLTGAETA
jgi:hypothetical protein